ncbi:alpha/beta hydrolase family protein [Paenibacillus tarimensis]|uniref:alpha/beta hydrolase family protein n=1 Tax=Paenibacillus tarimensis TaxID=416012 RepID=UPI001F45A757|nr:hypothetical protein [Paenibacillus tarimensis]MCF2945579.1 hypothetical protein [Paenibacillus tarimensis]
MWAAGLLVLMTGWTVHYFARHLTGALAYGALGIAFAAFGCMQWINGMFNWTYVPGYLYILMIMLATRKVLYPSCREHKLVFQWNLQSAAASAGMLIWLTLSAALPLYLFPAIQLDNPTGQYAVGTTTYYLADNDRPEARTDNPDDYRELVVQVWYPAEKKGVLESAGYHPHASHMINNMAEQFKFPAFLLANYGDLHTHVWKEAPLSEGVSFPVLVFSHGFMGSRVQNMFQIEELVSHGYVVFGIEHSYSASGTVLADGRKIKPAGNMASWPSDEEVQRDLDEWTADVQFVTDYIMKINEADPQGRFTGRLDTGRMGVFGHSFGGLTAANTLALDERFKAGMNMDGYPYGDVHLRELDRPFIHFSASDGLPPAETITDAELQSFGLTREQYKYYKEEEGARIRALTENGHWLRLEGAGHFSFTDLALWTPLAKTMGLMGSLDVRQAHDIINAYTLAFFDLHLKNKLPHESWITSDPNVVLVK